MNAIRSLALAAVAAALLSPAAALACKKAGADGQASCGDAAPSCDGYAEAAKPGTITVPALAALLDKKEKQLTVIDANRDATRASEGVIPGALLLTSAAKYDPAKELPAAKDQKLVFYCANARCTASHTAAQRALEAGWVDVAVLPDGIKGWKEAGKSTASVPRS